MQVVWDAFRGDEFSKLTITGPALKHNQLSTSIRDKLELSATS